MGIFLAGHEFRMARGLARTQKKAGTAHDRMKLNACGGLTLPGTLPLRRAPLPALFPHLPRILRHGPYAFLTLAAQSVELFAFCQRPTAPVATVDVEPVFILFHVSSAMLCPPPSPFQRRASERSASEGALSCLAL